MWWNFSLIFRSLTTPHPPNSSVLRRSQMPIASSSRLAARAPGGFTPVRCQQCSAPVASRTPRSHKHNQNKTRNEVPIQSSSIVVAEERRRRFRSGGVAVSASSTSSSSSSTSTSTSSSSSDADYLSLKGIQVYPAAAKGKQSSSVDLLSLFRASPEDRTALIFLTHGGDLAPQELVPRLAKKLPALRAQGVKVLVFLMGTPENAAAFAKTVGMGEEVEGGGAGGEASSSSGGGGGALFFADPTASAYDALGFSKGFDPELPLVGKGVLSGWVR
jgi:hypothetical protein